jgi:hypothetical protein
MQRVAVGLKFARKLAHGLNTAEYDIRRMSGGNTFPKALPISGQKKWPRSFREPSARRDPLAASRMFDGLEERGLPK